MASIASVTCALTPYWERLTSSKRADNSGTCNIGMMRSRACNILSSVALVILKRIVSTHHGSSSDDFSALDEPADPLIRVTTSFIV